MIRALDPATDAETCDEIVRQLPGWFGLAEGLAECALAVRTNDGLAWVDGGGLGGFLTYERASGDDHEITWMAVRPDLRGRGVGTQLVAALVEALPRSGSLLVKTLSDRDGDPGAEYSATRAFYLARGFTPVAELDIWGPENPCQVLARPLTPTSG